MFLETSARVGGAFIVDTIEAATGINLWREWAKVEIAGEHGSYTVPPHRHDYAGIVLTLARQETPDMSAYTDPEIATDDPEGLSRRPDRPLAPEPQRVETLIADYTQRFYRDFFATAPPPERPRRMIKRTLKQCLVAAAARTGATSTSTCRRPTRAASAIRSSTCRTARTCRIPPRRLPARGICEATIDRLAWRGIEAIYVGVHNAGRNRLGEYSPFPDPRHGGGDADAYLAFLVETLKPRIDRMFSTRRDRDSTAILGSSMGGLVSLYAYFRYPSVFARAGVMSPSIWFGQGAIVDFIREARVPRGRVYLDVGTGEGAGTLRDVRRLGRLLVRKGFRRRRRRRSPAPAAASGERRSSTSSALRYVEDRGRPPHRGRLGVAARGRARVPARVGRPCRKL